MCVCAWLFLLYLIDGHIVSWLLEDRYIVIAVSDNNADLVQNHCAHQLVGTLNLNHNGLNVGGGLEGGPREREQ